MIFARIVSSEYLPRCEVRFMNVELDSRTEELIKEKVASGRFSNASEVVREAIRRMEEEEHYEALRAAIAAGYEEAERGDLVPLDMKAAISASEENSRRGHKVSPLVTP
jgi:antitoxin ParD1/3/4